MKSSVVNKTSITAQAARQNSQREKAVLLQSSGLQDTLYYNNNNSIY